MRTLHCAALSCAVALPTSALPVSRCPTGSEASVMSMDLAFGNDVAVQPGDRKKHLLSAAVIVGRMPGEPATVLAPRTKPSLMTLLVGSPARTPLADPALEVVRAISASLARGAATIRHDLLAAANRVGLTPRDLAFAFPGVRLERI